MRAHLRYQQHLRRMRHEVQERIKNKKMIRNANDNEMKIKMKRKEYKIK